MVNIALGPGDSQMNKTVSGQKKLVAGGGGGVTCTKISSWCDEHHRQDIGEGKKLERDGRRRQLEMQRLN